MQMRTCSVPSIPHCSYYIILGYFISNVNIHSTEMGINCGVSKSMKNYNFIAITSMPACINHHSAGSCMDVGTNIIGDIQSFMSVTPSSLPKGGGYRSISWPHIGGVLHKVYMVFHILLIPGKYYR